VQNSRNDRNIFFIRMAFMGFSVGETIICKTWFVGNFIIIEKGRR